MPFDGIEYGWQPLIKPPQHHSDSRAVGDFLRRTLAASYAYVRTQHGYLGQVCWQQHPRRDSAQLTWGTLAAPGLIAQFNAFVPFWATHVVASLTYYVREQASVTVGFRVTVDSDVGALTEQQHKSVRTQAANLATGPVTFQSGIVDAFVERTNFPPGDSALSFEFGADNVEEASPVRVRVRPQLLTCFWVAVG